jgi:Na+/H+-dicarboxylate symporter
VALSPAELVVVALTASLAAVGAPAIPSAGLVTMIIVLQAVGLERFSGDLAAILAADVLLDRCRTAVNLLGDAYGVVAVDATLRRFEGRSFAYERVDPAEVELGEQLGIARLSGAAAVGVG